MTLNSFFLYSCLFFLSCSCKEFYDEEFKEFENSGPTLSNEDVKNTSYVASLESTDRNLFNLKGAARVVVQNDQVKVNLSVSGIPANIIQLHYTYLTVPCSSLSFVLPNDSQSTRTFEINETTSLYSLAFIVTGKQIGRASCRERVCLYV